MGCIVSALISLFRHKTVRWPAMGFASGSVSFRRFAVVGPKQPDIPSEELLKKLSDGALRPSDLGVPEPVEYGWSGGRHVLDGAFSFQHNVFNDCMYFALRVDTNKVPGELKKAYQIMEEEAAAKDNPSGFISKKQKKDAKDTVSRKVDDELRSGRFRRSKLISILWDLPNQTLYCQCGSSDQEKLQEIFSRTFNLEVQGLSGGSIALRILEPAGKRRDYEDLKPTRFVVGPGGESQYPDYPWVTKGPEPKDFLGNEFALWLWFSADAKDGVVKTDDGDITLMFDKALDLDCAYGESGKDSLRGAGPTRMPEAMDALHTGKVPRKAGLIMDAHGAQYTFQLGAENLAINGLQMPEVEEADTPRTLFEERITQLRDFAKSLDALYTAFLKVRTSSWETLRGTIRKWIVDSQK